MFINRCHSCLSWNKSFGFHIYNFCTKQNESIIDWVFFFKKKKKDLSVKVSMH